MTTLLTRAQAARYLRISIRTLDRRRAAGMLPYVCHSPGGRVLFREIDLANYIKSNLHK